MQLKSESADMNSSSTLEPAMQEIAGIVADVMVIARSYENLPRGPCADTQTFYYVQKLSSQT